MFLLFNNRKNKQLCKYLSESPSRTKSFFTKSFTLSSYKVNKFCFCNINMLLRTHIIHREYTLHRWYCYYSRLQMSRNDSLANSRKEKYWKRNNIDLNSILNSNQLYDLYLERMACKLFAIIAASIIITYLEVTSKVR